MAITRNTLTTASIHLIATGTTVVAGNNSVSNIALLTQNVTSASIRKITSSGTWSIARGSNVVWVTPAGGYTFDFAANGGNLGQDGTANVVATLTGTGSILIELSKESV